MRIDAENLPRVLVLSTSMNPDSRSWIMCREAQRALETAGIPATLFDLREHPVPAYNDFEGQSPGPGVSALREAADNADAFLLGIPVYLYGTPSPLKAAMEFMGRRLAGKAVGALVAAGGERSYMSVMHTANSLQLDFRSWWTPRFAYGTYQQFKDGAIADPELAARVRRCALETAALAARLSVSVEWCPEEE